MGGAGSESRRDQLAEDFHQGLQASRDVWQEVEDESGRLWEFNEFNEEVSNLKDAAKDILLREGPEEARRFYSAATGKATRLKDHYQSWLDEAQVAGQTKAQHGATVRQFIDWAGANVSIEEIDRKKSGSYVSKLFASGKARSTIKRHVSSLSMLWRWLVGRGFSEANVWRGLELGKKTNTSRRQLPYSSIAAVQMRRAGVAFSGYRPYRCGAKC